MWAVGRGRQGEDFWRVSATKEVRSERAFMEWGFRGEVSMVS